MLDIILHDIIHIQSYMWNPCISNMSYSQLLIQPDVIITYITYTVKYSVLKNSGILKFLGNLKNF